ncbi:MAG: PQQ-binding-like beta-propeller repeat protein [Ignavibacteriales bacterium]
MTNLTAADRKRRVLSPGPRLWIRRAAVVLAAGALLTAGIAGTMRLVAGRRRPSPGRLFAGRIAAGAVLAPGPSSVLAFWRGDDGIRVSRVPLNGAGVDSALVCADGVICAGDGAASVTDRATGIIRHYSTDATGVTPAWTTRSPGAVMAAASQKAVVVVTGASAGGKTGFRVKRLDTRGRALWDREATAGIPLFLRVFQGGQFIAGVLQVKEYPSTTLFIGNDSGWAETKPVPGLVKCVAAGAGLVVVGSGSSVYAHDLSGQLEWCIEPGGTPVDVCVGAGGVLAAVRKRAENGLASLFVGDFVAMYDVEGARLWKVDLKPGVTCVRCFGNGVLAGTSAGVVALDYGGRILWEVKLPSPVKRLEIAPGGNQFYVSTEAGELYSYSLGPA